MTSTRIWHQFCWFCLAVLSASVIGSIVQTQFNLAAIRSLGVPIPLTDWLSTMLADILGFTPVMAAITTAVFIVSIPVAGWLAKFAPDWRQFIFALGGTIGFLLALEIVDALAPMPTLIAATRDWLGRASMAVCAGLGCWLYGFGYESRRRQALQRREFV